MLGRLWLIGSRHIPDVLILLTAMRLQELVVLISG
jgi:hypothetical protein